MRPDGRRRPGGAPGTLTAAVQALAAGDAAAAWCVAVGATSGLLAGYLPEESARAIHAGPATMIAGVFAPRGRATAEAGGYRVSGRWPFASGCRHADWLMGGCVVDDGGTVRTLPNGMPDVRLVLAPAQTFTIHDTWHVVGLRATGSHDIELAGVHVPSELSASVFTDPPVQTGPLYAFPLFGLLALAISSVCLGIGRGALDDLVAIAGGKVPAGGRRTLAERATVQAEVARAEAALRAARALLDESIGEAWERAVASGERRRGVPGGPAPGRHARGRRRAAGHRDRLPAGRRQRDLRLEPAAAPPARRQRGHAAHARRARDLGADRAPAARAADGRDAALTGGAARPGVGPGARSPRSPADDGCASPSGCSVSSKVEVTTASQKNPTTFTGSSPVLTRPCGDHRGDHGEVAGAHAAALVADLGLGLAGDDVEDLLGAVGVGAPGARRARSRSRRRRCRSAPVDAVDRERHVHALVVRVAAERHLQELQLAGSRRSAWGLLLSSYGGV